MELITGESTQNVMKYCHDVTCNMLLQLPVVHQIEPNLDEIKFKFP